MNVYAVVWNGEITRIYVDRDQAEFWRHQDGYEVVEFVLGIRDSGTPRVTS